MDRASTERMRAEVLRRIESPATSPDERRHLPAHLKAIARRLVELGGGKPKTRPVQERVADAREAIRGDADAGAADRARDVRRAMNQETPDDVTDRARAIRRAMAGE